MTATVIGLMLVTTGATTLGALLPRRRPSTLDAHWRSVRRALPGNAINYTPRRRRHV